MFDALDADGSGKLDAGDIIAAQQKKTSGVPMPGGPVQGFATARKSVPLVPAEPPAEEESAFASLSRSIGGGLKGLAKPLLSSSAV